jgi:hypothetical protein
MRDLSRAVVHQIDTRRTTNLTIFDGCPEHESKLGKQFWNSVLLTPPVESTLVCKEIKQRTRVRTSDTGANRRKFNVVVRST